MARIPIGTALQRRYVLLGAIGQGGVSTVYTAVDTHHGRRLAIKILGRDVGGAARREAMITDRLRHPGVPRIHEYGDAALPDGTTVPYLVLDLVEGAPLAARLVHGRLRWPEAVRIAVTAADVLTTAHAAGIVHRDLVARNIMLTPAGVKIIDFGLAVTIMRGRSGCRPEEDVYALGVLLYEMLTGRSPYPPRIAATIMAAGRGALLAPTPVFAVAGLPPELRDLVRACMAKKPAERPLSADVAWRLRQVRLPSIN